VVAMETTFRSETLLPCKFQSKGQRIDSGIQPFRVGESTYISWNVIAKMVLYCIYMQLVALKPGK